MNKHKHLTFYEWGRWIYRLRWVVVATWLVLFALSAYFAMQSTHMLTDNGFTPEGSESEAGFAQLEEQLGYPPSMMQVVFASEDGSSLTSSEQRERLAASLAPLLELDYVDGFVPTAAARVSDREDVAAFALPLQLSTDEALAQYPDIRDRLQPPDGVRVYLTGSTPVMYDMQVASKRDIIKAEIIGLPIALLVLLLIFGTLLAALLPLIVGIVSVTFTLGVVYFIALEVSLSSFPPNMVTMLGLAVGIDYALFLVSRFREELQAGASIETAVARTSSTAGKSIFFSGLAVLIGLFAMLFIPLNLFYSLCLGGVLVVLTSVAAGNTLLLALLGIFGHRINSFHVIPRRWRRSRDGRFWLRTAAAVMKRPLLLAVVLIVLLGSLLLPLRSMQLGVPSAEVLPPSYESRYGYDLQREIYDARELTPIQISVQMQHTALDPRSLQALAELEAELMRIDGVKEVYSLLHVLRMQEAQWRAAQVSAGDVPSGVAESLQQAKLANGTYATVRVLPRPDPDTSEAEQLVREIRELDIEGLQLLVTGESAYRLDMIDRIHHGIPYVLLFVMVVTYLVLLAAFRSLLLPLKAVLMNVLSLGSSIGIVVLVFQHGYMAELLQISTTGYVNATLPVLIFCVVFGISMDYEVFLISRMMEEYEETGDNELSTSLGLQKTGGLITSAAAILIVVVGTFIFTDIEIMKALGLGLAVAVLLDATLIRILLVPALMKLLGRANWWAPAWMKPVRPRPARDEL